MGYKYKRTSLNRLQLQQRQEDDGVVSKLLIGLRTGYPRLTIYRDNNNYDNMDNIIIVPFTQPSFSGFLSIIENIIDDESNEKSITIRCNNNKWENDKRTDEIVTQATVTCFRDRDGVICLKISAPNKKSVIFKLTFDSKWHEVEGADNKRELSNIFTKGYVESLRIAISSIYGITSLEDDSKSI